MNPKELTLLADRYTLLRELGQGGMATVFLARDEKHLREVALKVLRPDLAAAVGEKRFLQEIQITAGLNHPHILPLLDSGASAGFLFYVMPHVTGGSLRRLLLSDAGIPLEAAVRITAEVASALDYAHGRGIVHRDIKPENVLFNEGLAVVSDFGIARAVSDAQRDGVTRTGLAVGTPGYMSPEQALGTGEVDARSDVYALGSLVYEMLVGATPAAWPGPEDVRLGRMADLPQEHREKLDLHPGRVEQVLTKALALRPGDRFGHAGEFARALETAAQRTRGFSDEQVRNLLARAAELQVQEPEEGAPVALTLGGVEQVAAQVGIPPEHVRTAAKELARREAAPVPTGRGEWRRPSRHRREIRVEEVVEGNIPEEAFPAMVTEIQRHLDLVGHASVIGGTLTWSPAAQSDRTRRVLISVTPSEGGTVIRIQESLDVRGFRRASFPVGAIGGVALGGALAGVMGVADPVAPMIIVLFGLGGLFAARRTMMSIAAGDREPQLRGLAGVLAEIGSEAVKKRLGSG